MYQNTSTDPTLYTCTMSRHAACILAAINAGCLAAGRGIPAFNCEPVNELKPHTNYRVTFGITSQGSDPDKIRDLLEQIETASPTDITEAFRALAHYEATGSTSKSDDSAVPGPEDDSDELASLTRLMNLFGATGLVPGEESMSLAGISDDEDGDDGDDQLL